MQRPVITRINAKEIKVNEVVVPEDVLSRVFKRGMDEACKLLSGLLVGGSVPLSFARMSEWLDNMTPGYMAKHDAIMYQGKLVEPDVLLVTRVENDPILRAKWIETVNGPEGAIQRLKADAVDAYVKQYEQLLTLLFFLVHLGGGMPFSGSDLTKFLACNSATCMRTLCLSPETFFVLPCHSMYPDAEQPRKLTPRFLPVSLSMVLALAYLIVRPFVMHCVKGQHAGGDEQAQVYKLYMFVHEGKQMTEAHMRASFTALFHQYCGISLSFDEYHYLAIFRGKELVRRLQQQLRTARGAARQEIESTLKTMRATVAESERDAPKHDG